MTSQFSTETSIIHEKKGLQQTVNIYTTIHTYMLPPVPVKGHQSASSTVISVNM